MTPLFDAETMLMGYGESDSSGAWIKLQVLPEHLDIFRGLKGKRFVTQLEFMHDEPEIQAEERIDPIGEASAPREKGPYGKQARDLFLSPILRAPDFWKILGKPTNHEAWIQQQPCLVCGDHDYIEPNNEPRCEVSHVLSADAMPSREGEHPNKPDYRAVPMTHECHHIQHNKGIVAVYQLWLSLKMSKPKKETDSPLELTAKQREDIGNATRDQAQAWLQQAALVYTKEWAWEKLAQKYMVQSVTQIPPFKIARWVNGKSDRFPNLFKLLPASYREALPKPKAAA